MIRMSRTTGKAIGDREHKRQSVEDILTTPKGTRVLRPNYGFDADLVDTPLNRDNLMTWYVGIATALRNDEPRLDLKRIALKSADAEGKAVFDLQLVDRETDERIVLGGMTL